MSEITENVEPDPAATAPAEQAPEAPDPDRTEAPPSPWDVAHIHGLRERLHELRGRMSRDLDGRRHSDGPQSPEIIDGNVARNHLTRAWDHLGAALERLGRHDGTLPTGAEPGETLPERETPPAPTTSEGP